LAWAAGVQAQVPDLLSDQERTRLAQGELVSRHTEERRGQLFLMGGQSWQVVDLPPDAVWRAIRDVDRYDHLVPGVERSRVAERHTDSSTVFMEHRHGMVEARYYLNVRFSDAQRIAMFQLDTSRPHDVNAGWGFFRVQPYGRDRSLLSYGIQMDLGTGIVIGTLRPILQEWLLKVPETVKEFVEGSGRRYYVRPTPR